MLHLERDGYPADPEAIYLTAGASAGVSQILGLALRHGDGCMIPIPQYPLYTATLAYVSATPLPYYLQETDNWSLNHDVLVSTVSKAKASHTPVKALCVINPGNPTGACLSEAAMRQVIQLCYDEGILLLADEVYQANIFHPEQKPFSSFKKVLRGMGEEVARGVELVSFHSISKGVSGECGRRGGYFECVNLSEEVMEQVYKMASVSLCPPVSGQVSVRPHSLSLSLLGASLLPPHLPLQASTPLLYLLLVVPPADHPTQIGVDLLVSPPKPGDPSYPLWERQTGTTLSNLRDRSAFMAQRFNSLPGMSCQPADGSMYLFPRLDLPAKAIAEAKKRDREPDVMYALDLLGK